MNPEIKNNIPIVSNQDKHEAIETRVHLGIRAYAIKHLGHPNFSVRIEFGRYIASCADFSEYASDGFEYAGEFVGPSLAWLSGKAPNTPDHFELDPWAWAWSQSDRSTPAPPTVRVRL